MFSLFRKTRKVLILDDFVTTGMTMGVVARAVLASNPGVEQFCGLCLAKNEKFHYAAEHGVELSNDSIPESWATIWDDTRE